MFPLSALREFITSNQLFTSGERILLAVSGGKDSVFMAHLFREAGVAFGIAHCNFGLRGAESDRDEQFVRELAAGFDVPLHVRHFNTRTYADKQRISIQMAARELRYQWFEEERLAGGYDYIALAQHQTDLVETVLINQLRGTGIAGLHGILPKNGRLIRPLLFLTAAEIDRLVTTAAIGWVEDSSNAETKYQRNKIRHEVLPLLRQINPSLEHTFAANAVRMLQAGQLVDKSISDLQARLLVPGNKQKIPIRDVKDLFPQELLLFGLLRPFGFHEEAVTRIISVLNAPSGRQFFSHTHRLIKDREYLIIDELERENPFSAKLKRGESLETLLWSINQLEQDVAGLPRSKHVACVDTNLLIYPLTIRYWQEGDRFMPLGMKGFKKLSDFFIGQKLNVAEKGRVPLLVNGNGDIVWIAGMRLDERYKIGPGTKKVSIFEFKIKPVGR
ncbi:tRNA lysidine(34) synthetase TilS [Pedobacter sp. SYP-B3415]|uniref:tRNA lysidine(34) synthetase TilS n=1 Tax=Pedobacter sp. SYP-B3415 TaxID=2496641 RepID=UPI00101D2F71|nr:tRNA lysidine(34) synthetase TilS [Pedobacter sp. SYP-B3415]